MTPAANFNLQRDSRLAKLAKIIALHDDPATTEGQRAACRHVGGKLAAGLGIEFSKEAIQRASGATIDTNGEFKFDVDEFVRDWMAKRKAATRDAVLDEFEKAVAAWQENIIAEAARAREAEAAYREQTKGYRRGQRAAEIAEHERQKRIAAGVEAPRWYDVDEHFSWLDRIEVLDALDDDDRALIHRVRNGVRDGCMGLYGAALARIDELLRQAFEASP
jgi:hypothetical protein